MKVLIARIKTLPRCSFLQDEQAVATVITREDCIICGVAWVNEVFKQLDASLNRS